MSPVLGSRLASEAWYMVSNQKVPFWSTPRSSRPTGWFGLKIFTGYSVIFIVFGSNLVMKGSPKSVYQTAVLHDDVMRLGGRPGEIVLGDDDTRGLALRSRHGLERILPVGGSAQIDRGKVFGEPAILLRCSGPLRVIETLRLDR